jgi:hypothetical protein
VGIPIPNLGIHLTSYKHDSKGALNIDVKDKGIRDILSQTREVRDFFNTSSGHAKKYTKTCKSSVSTYNQTNLESTQNQPRFLRLKFWAQAHTQTSAYLSIGGRNR